ncbi:MAG: nadB, partial [Planctomycetaceae bacterium]|nr:nadB [Planctomycetaceae bacterium]
MSQDALPQLTMPIARRSLVRFHPKRIPHAFTDVLIIGGGIAGLRAALEVESKVEVTIITKDVLQLSNSAWAQGGIAGVLDPLDDIANHFADTMAAGKGLCDPDVVEMVVGDAPEQIRQLIEFGTHFDEENGQIALTKEGGHSHRRIVHALGDATGKEVMRALIARIQQSPTAQIWEETFTIDLLMHEGVCRGALVWNP